MGIADGRIASLDFSCAEALHDAITVYGPAIHQMPHPPRPGEHVDARPEEKPAEEDRSVTSEHERVAPSVHRDDSELQELRARVEALEKLLNR